MRPNTNRGFRKEAITTSMKSEPLQFVEREDAVAEAKRLARRLNFSMGVRQIRGDVWDTYYAKYIPRSHGWPQWEVTGPDGDAYQPFLVCNSNLSNDHVVGRGLATGLQPPEWESDEIADTYDYGDGGDDDP